MRSSWQIPSPVGWLTLYEENGYLVRLSFGRKEEADGIYAESSLMREALAQLNAYFAGKLILFDLPLAPKGTAFQLKCWEALQQIPYGQTRTYGQQAQMIGQPTAVRAVGMANHCNPLPILIPCHRVIGKNGSLTGYAGGLPVKQLLLELEAGCGS